MSGRGGAKSPPCASVRRLQYKLGWLFFGPTGADFSLDFDRDSITEHLDKSFLRRVFGYITILLGYIRRRIQNEFVMDRRNQLNSGRNHESQFQHSCFNEVGAGTADDVFGKEIETRPRIIFLRHQEPAKNGPRRIIAGSDSLLFAFGMPAANSWIAGKEIFPKVLSLFNA